MFDLEAWQIAAIAGLVVWDMLWKAVGMWHAAGNKQLGWFVAIMIVNSVGVLPILYLMFFAEDQEA